MLNPRSLFVACLVAVIALVAAMPAAAAELDATVFNKAKRAGQGSLTPDRRAGGGFALTAVGINYIDEETRAVASS